MKEYAKAALLVVVVMFALNYAATISPSLHTAIKGS